MNIVALSLNNFRNFSKLDLKFSPKITLIVGDNASGKTNILEAIFFLSCGKSFRTQMDKEMIRWGEELGRVKGEIVAGFQGWTAGAECLPSSDNLNERITNLEVILTTGLVQNKKVPLKKYLVNDVSRRLVDFAGHFKVVLFFPEDIQLVYGEPALRRNYLDSVLEQADKRYWRVARAYQKVVYQRNRLLEQINKNGVRRDQLDFWDDQLVKLGNFLTQKRNSFLDFLNDHRQNENNLQWLYKPSRISAEKIKDCRGRDIAAMMTLSGPHRDDFQFLLSGHDLAAFGSRGEQRTAVLALKLGEIEYLTQIDNQRPILLLDDIFSELDEEHRRYVLQIIPKQQTIITTTDPELIEKSYLEKMKVIRIRDA